MELPPNVSGSLLPLLPLLLLLLLLKPIAAAVVAEAGSGGHALTKSVKERDAIAIGKLAVLCWF